tara:strand:+ start:1320 stop:1964 length:645 start_codon:yes stop_codon:yes gene_type:complete
MHNVLNNLISIKEEIQQINPNTKIIAVSKTFPLEKIKPIIDSNHIHFGENKVQEALKKWSKIKEENKNIKLHLIGKLQTNKVKYCLPLFDYIHSLDSIKLADKIANEQVKKKFKPKVFLQINIGDEQQKSGADFKDTENLYVKIKNDFDLDIVGLMCIPPNVPNTKPFFEKMYQISKKLNLNELSMGMSNDYLEAAKSSATFVRIGSKIFGERN